MSEELLMVSRRRLRPPEEIHHIRVLPIEEPPRSICEKNLSSEAGDYWISVSMLLRWGNRDDLLLCPECTEHPDFALAVLAEV